MIVPTLDGIAESHKVATLVELLVDGRVEDEISETIDGSVTFDSRAASRARLSLSVATELGSDLIPTDPDGSLAPYGNELRVSRGLYVNGEPHLVRLGVFRIGRATADGERVQISGLDRSKVVINATFERPYNVPSGADLIETIKDVISGGYPQVVYGDFVDVEIPLPALIADEDDDRWAFAQGLATAAGCMLYFDADGEVRLRLVPTTIAGNPIATIAEASEPGDTGATLLSADRDWDEELVNNKVTVTGENTSEDTVARGEAIDDNPLSPTYYYGRFGHKPMPVWSNPYILTDEQAGTAAAALLAEKTGKPDVVSLEALVDPARRPWDVVRIRRERLGIDQDHILDSVTIPLSRESGMSAVTRATQEVS